MIRSSSDAEILSNIKLSDILKNRTLTACFKVFLQSEYSGGNLMFWLKCEEYSTLPDEKRNEEAKNIFNKYISSESIDQVNVSYVTLRKISNALMNEDTPSSNLFHHAQKSMYLIMENDSMPRFLQTKFSKVVIKETRRAHLHSRISRFRKECRGRLRALLLPVLIQKQSSIKPIVKSHWIQLSLTGTKEFVFQKLWEEIFTLTLMKQQYSIFLEMIEHCWSNNWNNCYITRLSHIIASSLHTTFKNLLFWYC